MVRRLEAYASERQMSVSSVVRQALAQFAQREMPETQPDKTRSGPRSDR